MHPATALVKTPETTETKQVDLHRSQRRTQGQPDRKDEAEVRHPVWPVHLQQTDRDYGTRVWQSKEQGMGRFTLRGKKKVNTQWRLFGGAN